MGQNNALVTLPVTRALAALIKSLPCAWAVSSTHELPDATEQLPKDSGGGRMRGNTAQPGAQPKYLPGAGLDAYVVSHEHVPGQEVHTHLCLA